MKERTREDISNFLWGSAIPSIVTVPGAIYLTIDGNYDALVGLAEIGLPLHALWGFNNMREAKGTYAIRREHKEAKVKRRRFREAVIGRPPHIPAPVEKFMSDEYQKLEHEALANFNLNVEADEYDSARIFMTGLRDSAHRTAMMGIRLSSHVFEEIQSSRVAVRYSTPEEREVKKQEVRLLMSMLKTGYYADLWFGRGNRIEADDQKPYPPLAVAALTYKTVVDACNIKDRKGLEVLLRTLQYRVS